MTRELRAGRVRFGEKDAVSWSRAPACRHRSGRRRRVCPEPNSGSSGGSCRAVPLRRRTDALRVQPVRQARQVRLVRHQPPARSGRRGAGGSMSRLGGAAGAGVLTRAARGPTDPVRTGEGALRLQARPAEHPSGLRKWGLGPVWPRIALPGRPFRHVRDFRTREGNRDIRGELVCALGTKVRLGEFANHLSVRYCPESSDELSGNSGQRLLWRIPPSPWAGFCGNGPSERPGTGFTPCPGPGGSCSSAVQPYGLGRRRGLPPDAAVHGQVGPGALRRPEPLCIDI